MNYSMMESLALLALLAGCTDFQEPSGQTASLPPQTPVADEIGMEKIVVTDGVKHPASVSLGDLVQACFGGKDCLPSLDRPRFETVQEAEGWMGEEEGVLALAVDGETKAYPTKILDYHPVVNDTVGGLPVVVAYSPLCGAGRAFSRIFRGGGGSALEFGVSGKVHNSCLVMYDRKTGSYWRQMDGRAITGELAGENLEAVPLDVLPWRAFKKAHPSGRVLSRGTGIYPLETYESYPYGNYRKEPGLLFPVKPLDERLEAKAWVLGVEAGKESKEYMAYPEARVREEGAVNDEVGGMAILAVEDEESGAIRGFARELEGRELTFSLQDDKLLDKETGSEWNGEGRSEKGPLAGKRLERVDSVRAYWFAWAAHHPDTEVWRNP